MMFKERSNPKAAKNKIYNIIFFFYKQINLLEKKSYFILFCFIFSPAANPIPRDEWPEGSGIGLGPGLGGDGDGVGGAGVGVGPGGDGAQL